MMTGEKDKITNNAVIITRIMKWPNKVGKSRPNCLQVYSLYVAWGVSQAKCILLKAVCVSVCLSLAIFPHCCTDPGVTWGMVGGAL